MGERLLHLEGLLCPLGGKSQIFCWEFGTEFRLGSSKRIQTFLWRRGISKRVYLLLSIKDQVEVWKHYLDENALKKFWLFKMNFGSVGSNGIYKWSILSTEDIEHSTKKSLLGDDIYTKIELKHFLFETSFKIAIIIDYQSIYPMG